MTESGWSYGESKDVRKAVENVSLAIAAVNDAVEKSLRDVGDRGDMAHDLCKEIAAGIEFWSTQVAGGDDLPLEDLFFEASIPEHLYDYDWVGDDDFQKLWKANTTIYLSQLIREQSGGQTKEQVITLLRKLADDWEGDK
tara:strand:+ start:1736 stop:2155 length:420 start_codon:yes stop_codon:yes gene_type:complete